MLYTKADITNKDGKIEGIASTSVIDRQNESVNVDGWDVKSFKKSPRLLWAHDHNEPAIGKVTKISVDGEGKKKALKFEAVFQDVTEKARAINELVKQGFINTFSVGFKALEAEGEMITKQELLEISVVNVPANPEAMLLAYKSLHKAGFEDSVIKEVGLEIKEENDLDLLKVKVATLEKAIESANEKAELAVKGIKHLNPHRSKNEVAVVRLSMSKVISRTSDKLLSAQTDKSTVAVSQLKVIKRSSEILSRSLKGDL